MEITTVKNGSNQAQVQSGGKTLGKDDFLKLFTMQLRFQNPLNPMDSTEFTSQLAQFSTLEQMNNINTRLGDLLIYQNSIQNTLATSLIGKDVRVSSDEVYLKDRAEIIYSLSKDASKVKITIYDSNGKVVREIEKGRQNSGDNTYVWDGKDSGGNPLPEGSYKFKVEAFDASGNPVDVTTMAYGTVTGITFENNITYLVINNKLKVRLGDVKEIRQGGV